MKNLIIRILLMLMLAHLMINAKEKIEISNINVPKILVLGKQDITTVKENTKSNLIVKEVTIEKNTPPNIEKEKMDFQEEIPNENVQQIELPKTEVIEDIYREELAILEKESEKIDEVLEYVNQYRKEVGEKPLILSKQLSIAATIRSLEMTKSGIIEHIRPDGRECFSIFEDMQINATSMGENIAYGYQTASEVSKAWKESSTHYDTIINSNYNYIGIGIVSANGTYYWTQLFANAE